MPNVIDSLVVTLGLDASKFTQQQRDAVDAFRKTQDQASQSGKDIEAQGKKVDEFFSSMKRGALMLTGAFFGGRGIKEFVGYITTMDASIARTSRTLGESAQELSAWQNIARQTGGSTESITSAFHGLTQEMNLFLLGRGGESALLPVLNTLGLSIFDEAKNLKTASRLYLEISEAIQKSGADAPRNAAMLSLVPGMNQESINLLLKGRGEIEKMLEEQRKLTRVTNESAAAAERLGSAWARMQTSAENLGRAVMNRLTPFMTDLLDVLSYGATKAAGGETSKTMDDRIKEINRKQKEKEYELERRMKPWLNLPPASSSSTGPMSAAEEEAYTRKAALARGIDPNVAVAVVKSEGGFGTGVGQSKVIRRDGSREESYGPFQLYMGGGLGNKFQKETGLDPRDPSTRQRQIDWSLDEANKSGWGAWHGWKGLPTAGIGGAPAGAGPASVDNSRSNSSNSNVSIGKIEVHTSATDAEGIARDIGPAMQRSGVAASANNALR